MRGEEQEIRKAVDEMGQEIKPGLMEKVGEMVKTLFDTGRMPLEAMGFNNEKLDIVYGQAYRLYNSGNYNEAANLFRLLMVLDPTEVKYGLGLGACFHMLKEYENAVKTYVTVGIMDSTSPLPYFHASDCYIQMRDKASAILCLDMAVKRAGNKPEYQVLKDRALLSIDSLKQELMQQS